LRPCECCTEAREFGYSKLHCPSCLWCGARLIQQIGKSQIAVSAAKVRQLVQLAVWMNHGHSEPEIRRLVKLQEAPIAPIEPVVEKPKRSARRS